MRDRHAAARATAGAKRIKPGLMHQGNAALAACEPDQPYTLCHFAGNLHRTPNCRCRGALSGNDWDGSWGFLPISRQCRSTANAMAVVNVQMQSHRSPRMPLFSFLSGRSYGLKRCAAS